MKLNKQQLLRSYETIIKILHDFLNKVIAIEQQYGREQQFSSYLIPGTSSIEQSLSDFADQDSANKYELMINEAIDLVISWKHKIENTIASEEQYTPLEDKIKKALLDLDPIFWLRVSGDEEIENIHHRIWFGSFLPYEYRDYLLNFKKYNPCFKIILWTDFKTLNFNEFVKFILFCSENNFTLIDIRKHKGLINYDLIKEELDEIKSDSRNAGVHCARASDLARVAILIEHGGIYADTDTNTHYPLPDLKPVFGFLIKKEPNVNLFKKDRLNYRALLYDFIASQPNNKILCLAAKISQLDYAVYHRNEDTCWRNSQSYLVHNNSTIRLTGTAIFCALNFLLIHQGLPKKNVNSLFFHSENYMKSYYDKSWLAHLEEDTLETREEQLSLLRFLKEIDTAREDFLSSPMIQPNLDRLGFFNKKDSTSSTRPNSGNDDSDSSYDDNDSGYDDSDSSYADSDSSYADSDSSYADSDSSYADSDSSYDDSDSSYDDSDSSYDDSDFSYDDSDSDDEKSGTKLVFFL